MKFNPDDPKWTAYVLGELSDAESAELEKELESSAAARDAVEEIRMATLLLKDEFAKEAPAALLAEQRRTIRAEAMPQRSWGLRQFAFAGAAACLMIGMIAAPFILKSQRENGAANIAEVLPAAPASQASKQARDAAPESPSEARQKVFASEPAAQAPAESLRDEEKARTASAAFGSGASIQGVLKDSSGAVLPGAAVTITDTKTGKAQMVVTDETGRYAVSNLPDSNYEVEATLPGFRTFVQNGVKPDNSADSTVNPVLQVGQVSEQVEIQANAVTVETRSAAVSGAASGGRARSNEATPAAAPPPAPASAAKKEVQQILELPLNGRNVQDLVAIAPGVVAPARPVRALDRVDRPAFNTEAYDEITDNPFLRVSQQPLATFSIDVDTASYANMRRFLSQNQLPPRDSVRIEEMINYFSYDYASPAGARPIAAYTEIASAPWQPDHRLVRIGIKGRDIDPANRPPSNLVFLIDVSGSMNSPEKLPLLKAGMNLLVDKLTENDRVAIVVYAGASGVVLRSTTGDRKQQIRTVIEQLGAGGSTNGAAGIRLAYDTAVANFIRGGTNRVVLATDGDFNVGITNQGDLLRLIEDKAKSNVFLTVLGFGMGNYKDSTLEKLADKGNGNYAYIDTINEARKVLVEEVGGTLMTIAKDVKIQVEFNPAQVNAYRLIGYENRVLRNEDFNDDRKDAGDMGAGHTVTALFEVVPNGVEISGPGVDPLKYQQPAQANRQAGNRELLNLKVRYKEPEGTESRLLEVPVLDRGAAFSAASGDYRFAAAVASFGMILRDSPHKGQSTLDAVIDMAERSKGADRSGYREEFVRLARKARALKEIQ